MKSLITCDLSQFGIRELRMAEELLKAYTEQRPENLGDGLSLSFNTESGCVFLVDEDYNVFMMNDDNLEQFFTCPYCGHEGFKENMFHKPLADECEEFMSQIGVEQ